MLLDGRLGRLWRLLHPKIPGLGLERDISTPLFAPDITTQQKWSGSIVADAMLLDVDPQVFMYCKKGGSWTKSIAMPIDQIGHSPRLLRYKVLRNKPTPGFQVQGRVRSNCSPTDWDFDCGLALSRGEIPNPCSAGCHELNAERWGSPNLLMSLRPLQPACRSN